MAIEQRTFYQTLHEPERNISARQVFKTSVHHKNDELESLGKILKRVTGQHFRCLRNTYFLLQGLGFEVYYMPRIIYRDNETYQTGYFLGNKHDEIEIYELFHGGYREA